MPVAIRTLMILLFLISCGINDPDKDLEQNGIDLEDMESVHIDYNGIIPTESGQIASFTIVNDSTQSIQYFGYSETNLLYNEEALADTGWTSLMWGWCGTGAAYYVLEPDSSRDFEAFLPLNSCTWRLVLEITDVNMENTRLLRSEPIQFTTTENN